MREARRPKAWQTAEMQDLLWSLGYLILAIAAAFAPIGYFFFAGVVTSSVVGDNERARHVMGWLFLIIWMLIIVLLYAWFDFGGLDAD